MDQQPTQFEKLVGEPLMRELERIQQFRSRARHIAVRFRQIDLVRHQETLRAFEELENFDSSLTELAIEAFGNRADAAVWLATHNALSVTAKTPWECLADGQFGFVQMILESEAASGFHGEETN